MTARDTTNCLFGGPGKQEASASAANQMFGGAAGGQATSSQASHLMLVLMKGAGPGSQGKRWLPSMFCKWSGRSHLEGKSQLSLACPCHITGTPTHDNQGSGQTGSKGQGQMPSEATLAKRQDAMAPSLGRAGPQGYHLITHTA